MRTTPRMCEPLTLASSIKPSAPATHHPSDSEGGGEVDGGGTGGGRKGGGEGGGGEGGGGDADDEGRRVGRQGERAFVQQLNTDGGKVVLNVDEARLLPVATTRGVGLSPRANTGSRKLVTDAAPTLDDTASLGQVTSVVLARSVRVLEWLLRSSVCISHIHTSSEQSKHP